MQALHMGGNKRDLPYRKNIKFLVNRVPENALLSHKVDFTVSFTLHAGRKKLTSNIPALKFQDINPQ